jgi:hypothetical protein
MVTAKEMRRLTKDSIIENIENKMFEQRNNGEFRTFVAVKNTDSDTLAFVRGLTEMGYEVLEDLKQNYTHVTISWEN